MTCEVKGRPELSYVLSATSAEEVHKAAAWLRNARLSQRVEVVMAAPGRVFGMVADRVIPPWVKLVAADTVDRRLVQIAGARESTGAVVIIVSCGDDLDAKLRDPFATRSGSDGGEVPPHWIDGVSIELPPGIGEHPAESVIRFPSPGV